MARYDLLRAACFLAARITKWNTACDKLLHRLVCYVVTTKEVTVSGWVGDQKEALSVVLYTDADFAGDVQTKRVYRRGVLAP